MAEEGIATIATIIIILAVISITIWAIWQAKPYLSDLINNLGGDTYSKEPANYQLISPENLPIGSTGERISGSLLWPVDSPTLYISSCFALRQTVPSKTKTTKDDSSRCHAGLDIPAPKGRAVFAAADGTVEDVDPFTDSGGIVLISHGGFWTRYIHLDGLKIKVKEKQPVKAGDTIAFVQKDHLHFEVIESLATGTLTDAQICQNSWETTKKQAIVVYAYPVFGGKASLHINPFCFFNSSIQEKVLPNYANISCTSETGGVGKGCVEYLKLATHLVSSTITPTTTPAA